MDLSELSSVPGGTRITSDSIRILRSWGTLGGALLHKSGQIHGITNAHVSPRKGERIYLADSGEEIARNIESYLPMPGRINDKDLSPLEGPMWGKEILKIGELKGLQAPVAGQKVQKYGARTQYTTGIITQIGVTVNVWYGSFPALVRDCAVIKGDSGKFMDGGDSGNFIVLMDGNLVAHGFAGDQAGTGIGYSAQRFTELGYTAMLAPPTGLPKTIKVEWTPDGLRIIT